MFVNRVQPPTAAGKLTTLAEPRARSVAIIATAFVALALMATSAHAETTGPIWKIMAVPSPTNFKPGDKSSADVLLVAATNVGGGSTDGSPVTISDSLPKGLTLAPEGAEGRFGEKFPPVLGVDTYKDPQYSGLDDAVGAGPPRELSCSPSPNPHCTDFNRVDPGDTLILTIKVDVESDIEGSGEVNGASVSGGGAVNASVSDPVTISSARPEYGL